MMAAAKHWHRMGFASLLVAAVAYLTGAAAPAEPARSVPASIATDPAPATAGTSACNTPSPDAPRDAELHCDLDLGWRMFAWIGESGDGIVQVQELVGSEWTERFFGPFCPSGVAAATPDQLSQLGMPAALANAWGYPPSTCTPSE